jgi:hypothetical protein
MMKDLLNPDQSKDLALARAQAQAVARVQESLTKNIPYKKLGQP